MLDGSRADRRTHIGTLSAVVFAALILASCANSASSHSATPVIHGALIETVSAEQILYGAGGIVVGTVESVSDTAWNQESGEPWEPVNADRLMDGDYTIATVYMDVDVIVERVIRDEIGVGSGGLLTIRVQFFEQHKAADLYAPGNRLALSLERSAFYMREGPISVIRPLRLVQGASLLVDESGVVPGLSSNMHMAPMSIRTVTGGYGSRHEYDPAPTGV